MKTIFYVRHGQSESNRDGLLSGRGNDPHLTATGRAQAKQTGQDLKAKDIQLIVSSPMVRTVETATIIAKEIGYDPKNIVQNPLFLERAYGIYEGRPYDIFSKDYEAGTVHESVETEKQLYDRIQKAIGWLREQKEDRILVVSHGAAGRAFYVIKEALHYSHMYKIDRLGNAEVFEFDL